MKRLIPVTYFALAWLLISCGNNEKPSGTSEGKIVYDITFPNEKNSVMMDLYPKHMTFHFKGDLMHSEIKSSYDLLTTDFIIDNKNKQMVQLLKNMSQRYAMKLDDSETQDWLKKYPEMKLVPSTETETIAGYVCQKTTAHFPNDSLPPIELFYTKDIGMEANWWNQFTGIDGFLMGYEIEQYGKRMKLRATEVKFESVDDSKFAIPENFQPIDAAGMDTQITSVVKEFMQ